jgi:hypothetical protein
MKICKKIIMYSATQGFNTGFSSLNPPYFGNSFNNGLGNRFDLGNNFGQSPFLTGSYRLGNNHGLSNDPGLNAYSNINRINNGALIGSSIISAVFGIVSAIAVICKSKNSECSDCENQQNNFSKNSLINYGDESFGIDD